ncbi:SDR family NAD(P)-dependent oxidoreductase [Aurantimonas aggregata]|uniref:SDR family NAD(P)-dependent oxidoreductase n=1 Tax=Aurantimonas aggregata TaxID=2047720 RepID=A0A6L9MBZ6_9HYPH|nr:SDR family NAD(P)-dependent oxidoreductase [Aurantimonas aggregata]NDV85374.1 SDR family NAD(P)-dependent oxidoreductase [Aurantimonas aggregata]
MARRPPREPIAIIGLGLRLPGADSLDGFWNHLAAGRSLIAEVPAGRFDPATVTAEAGKGAGRVCGGFVDDADCFDASLFGISPREAAWMDPQQRFALEMAWHAIEDSGYRAADLAGSRTGVYMGVCHWDYAELLEKYLARVDAYTPTGIAFSIIANRISHFFDFHGPSITNDTACAASMTALYQAVRALQEGDCDMALAGGVNLIWSPNHFVAFAKAGMLSKNGEAKAFDDRADGYVRGEGGAVLLLKPLSKALADDDPIHALVRGVGVNHGGRTNSLTVTSPAAQAELIAGVIRVAGVGPQTISYVEAHGPGTPLGDPIEIAGLKQAFAALAAEAGVTLPPDSCGIGSVKTNIGHLEGAAGVAGIVKVLAALRHGRLPANVGFGQLNRLIDLSETPFRIQSEATDWPSAAGEPRRACVSSFGFGGSNGHVLLEEPPATLVETDAGSVLSWHVIPISSATEDGLPAYAARLLNFIEGHDDTAIADLARTFQTGRTAMPVRRAFVARDAENLAEALRAFLADPAGPLQELPAGDLDGAKAQDLARRFVAGEEVDWAANGQAVGRRIAAPLYPFARERHWMDLSTGTKDQDAVRHPLVHRNVSGLDGAGFETRLSADMFVLADHHVGGIAVLPGVACLEMARAAASMAGALAGAACAIETIVWSRPIQAPQGQGVVIETRLNRAPDGGIGFAIMAGEGATAASPNVQGMIRPLSEPGADRIDLAALKARIRQAVSTETCYARLGAGGVAHGPAFRALAQVSCGENEALALLKLPRRLLPTLDSLQLHPVLLDAAIQAWVAIGEAPPPGAAVPFACARIEVLGPCEATMWAHVRLRPGKGDATRRLDIDLVDGTGERRVIFHDLALRVIAPGAATITGAAASVPAAAGEEASPVVLARGAWQDAPLKGIEPATAARPRVLIAGWDDETAAALARRTGLPVEALDDVDGLGLAAATEILFACLHGVVGDVMRSRPREPVRLLVLARETLGPAATAPLAALLRTATLENPKIGGRLVALAGEACLDRLSALVLAEASAADTLTELRYEADNRRRAWMPWVDTWGPSGATYSADPAGVYWITGGLGGLGLIFAEWLVARGARTLILSGRRAAPEPAAEARLQKLRADGARVEYAACDLASEAATARFTARIARDYGPLKGIIHAAGVLDDGYILSQDVAAAASVFAPKIAGTVHLDRATRQAPLDFFVLCSSVASVFGNPGQAIYAGANAFMDGFAEARAADVSAGRAFGRTVAVAWALWRDGGMSVDAATLAAMQRRLGLSPMPSAAGLAALDALLTGTPTARTTVLYGGRTRIDAMIAGYGLPASGTPPVAPAQEPSGDAEALLQPTIEHVRAILADVLEMDAARIRVNQALSEYGLDSIAIVETTNRLEEALGPLSKTLLFEYVDLEAIAGHLVAEHAPALRLLLESDAGSLAAMEPPVADAPVAAQKAPPAAAAAAGAGDRVRSASIPVSAQAHAADGQDGPHDIAIIGLSLHVAGADDQQSFWQMLSEGQHGFEPVPAERWDNGALHHGERDVLGKTVVRTGAFLKDIDKFDPRYFRISQAEAELMSPEVRLFLQASVEAFEDAGYSRQTIARRHYGDVAVIVGSMTNEYDLYGFQNMLMRGALASGSYTGTVPNMVSYYYGLTGPSYFLDTMCSASATCVHEAVHMLRAGRCQMALAGGVSLLLHPQKLIATSQEHFTAKSAEVIRGYGLGAEGTILGEGVGAVVLKRLVDARRDGDRIYGVIIGTGISNAGARNGFTVPSPAQQAAAIDSALCDAGISAASIGYIEGHGSGTALGDPIEIKALTQVFRKATDGVQVCPIGTVKGNVAHLLAASGLAGIAKVLMQLKHGQLAPSLHAETLNPDIPFATSPFYVQRELSAWPRLVDDAGRAMPRRAGVTSIGAGGMNSHIVIEESPEPAPLPVADLPELLVFSGLDPARLRAVLQRFAAHLREGPPARLADLAYTLQVGRNELSCRLALVAADCADALAAIDAFLAGTPRPGTLYTPSILDADPPRDRAALETACDARDLGRVGAAWCAGAAVDWDRLAGGRALRRVSLPAYPFEKVRCWYQEAPDAPSVVHPMGARSKLHPFIGVNLSDAGGLRYRTPIHLAELRDYVFAENGRDAVLPMVVPEIMAAAVRIAGLGEGGRLADIVVEAATDWPNVRELTIRIEPGTGGHRIAIGTVGAAAEMRPWAHGTFLAPHDGCAVVDPEAIDVAGLRASADRTLGSVEIRAALKDRHLGFGPFLDSLDQAWFLPCGGLLASLRTDAPQQDHFKQDTRLPAPAWGAAFQALLLAMPDFTGSGPWSLDGAAFADGAVADVLCRPSGQGRLDILFLGEGGRVVAMLSGFAPAGKAMADAPASNPAIPEQQDASLGLLAGDLRQRAAAILKFAASDIGLREHFHDLGFDSISLARYAADVSLAHGIDLSPAIFFECEHIAALAAHLADRHGVVVAVAPEKPVGPVAARAAANPADRIAAPARPGPAGAGRPQTASWQEADDRIAIIGMAGRFPGSPDVESFFDHLLAGRDLTSDLPLYRYSPAYTARLREGGFALHGGFLDNVDRFDAAHFKISPVEAERMDPQQRLLLETAWRALEDAGLTPQDLPRDTGVFVGISALDYAALWRAEGLPVDGYLATGNSLAMAANRLSHQFDLGGPSQAVDTACSSSLIALLRARDALRLGQCSAAIVAGVNLCLSADGFEGPHLAGMLSPSGRCITFGAAADGYARGEGAAALLVKRLGDAELDGDRILAVVAGGAENHGGRSGALTAPNAKAQARLVTAAMAGIDPRSVSYVEAHGTGTGLGDPVEINGLRRAYETLLDGGEAGPQGIGLGAVKSNIGHLEAAAGLAAVIKIVMAMRRNLLPPTLHATPPNPHIDLAGSPFRLVTAPEAWLPAPDGSPRRAGVSSFGFGGANAHVVLESHDRPDRPGRAPLPPRAFATTRFWLPTAERGEPDRDTARFAPIWVPRDAEGPAFRGRRIVIGCGVGVAAVLGAEVEQLALGGADLGQDYTNAAVALLDLLRREIAAPGHDAVLIQLAVPAEGAGLVFAGLGAMLATASLEEPRIGTQLVEIPPGSAPHWVAGWLADAARDLAGSPCRYESGRRHVRAWQALDEVTPAHRWRDGGVYLVTGGMGGLGRIVAEDIARTARRPVIVLAGARPVDADRSAFLEQLRDLGAVTAYRQVDMADAALVDALVAQIVEVHGGLNGVVHAAGTLRDGFLVGKTADDLRAVLAPKIAGALALREACRGLDLDAFALFSSLAGAFGNEGQADYAAANGFLDGLARTSDGAILSIDWPLWRDGGMRVDEPTEAALFGRMGQRPLGREAGIGALHHSLAAGQPQVAVIAGDATLIEAFFAADGRPAASTPRSDHAVSTDLLPAVRAKLGALFGQVSGLAPEAIDPAAALENYGIDSLMITRLNAALGDNFAGLPKTLFFRHRTLAAVADHLLETQPAACQAWTDGREAMAGVAVTSAAGAALSGETQIAASAPANEPIAIIGMSGTYPDAPDLGVFWDNLVAGHDAVRELPPERWSLDDVFEPDPDEAVAQGKSYSKWGAFLDGFADFDPLFFKLSPREAAAMDPQERLFMTCAWQACEDAGYTPARLKSVCGDGTRADVGVFVGVTKTGYALHDPFRTESGATVRPTTSFAGIANRVSHLLDLSGPSLSVDTMCSSSLTAIHEACENLRAGRCAMAIAGGVNLYLHPATYVELSAARMLSPTGLCRSFGAGADGFVPGEGVGALLLKPLSRALADGDRIHALIRGSAVNHGGRTHGYTVPNPVAQRDVIRSALTRAGVDASAVSYVEAHGTGTDLGDPIEIDGLTEAFAADGAAPASCALGSVKSAIGHLEAAAGIAGVTKIVLQMKHRMLVPSLHAAAPNPAIDLASTPFVLQRQAGPWEGPRIAGVSSFGAGGANAHVVLEEWIEQPAKPAPDASAPRAQLFVLSARNPDRLNAAAARLLAFVRETGSKRTAAPDAVTAALCERLAEMLDVPACDIDPAEGFDALGLETAHLPMLTRWIAAEYGFTPDRSDVGLAGTTERLAAIIQAHAAPARGDGDLADIAYTLQVGREAMDCRLAIVAGTTAEMVGRLEAWLAGRNDDPAIVDNARRPLRRSLPGEGAGLDKLQQTWESGRLDTVADHWAQGGFVDWHALRHRDRARIVSLPTYPFETNRYWIPPGRPVANPAGSPDGPDDLTAAITVGAGNVALAAEIAALESAIAAILAPVLETVAHAPIAPGFRPWIAAAKDLCPTAADPSSLAEAWASWTALRQTGLAAAQMTLAEATLRALPDILTGRRRPTDVIFPEGRQTLVEATYKQNAVARRFSRTLAVAAASAVQAKRDLGRKLRILEIGAGTGGTSEPVFEALRPWQSLIGEYAYSDVSRAFLIHAERSYADRVPGLTTLLFDIEKPLADQAIDAGCYDLVIAANVLHATADIHRTLSHVRETMGPGGILLLNETAMPTLFTHVTFGLLEGWWRFADPERRIAGTPSLRQEMWREALAETGFGWLAGSSAAERALGQQVIAARATGAPGHDGAIPASVLRHSQASKKEAAPGGQVEDRAEPQTASSLRSLLLGALAETLNVAHAHIDVERSFADYGLDSILGAEFVHRLRKALSIDLDQTGLFDFASVERLEAFLTRQYPGVAARSAVRPEPEAALVAVPAPQPPCQTIGKERGREPIAIVGASGRFAGSETIEALWQHLSAGDDLVQPVTRFDLAPFYRDAEPGTYATHGSFIDGIDRFDPVFFGISGVEATYMDPQQRLFLEEAWKALENAGHAGEDMVGRRCGVFVGCAHGDYQELFDAQPPGQAFWGNTTSLIPARISYWLDLKGPAVAIDTACSSSLVAIHMACQSLWSGDSDMALAGGVFIQCSPRFFRYANAAKMLSPSGRCAAFGAGADGIVPGEAVGAVLLRPLAEALADGDTVLGVIVGSGVNQDGTTNGITAPSAASQEGLIRQVYAEFAIDPASIDLVEAHGTGTVLGDPIEHAALVRAFADGGSRDGPTYLGSVKSNIGHATTAAGIAGLAKVLSSLQHQTIPPTLHFGGGNPAIDFAGGPFTVNEVPVAWPAGAGRRRRAAVSSFGFGGTNAHLVVEEAGQAASIPEPRRTQLIVLSARSPEQLRAQAAALCQHLDGYPEILLEDVAFTLVAGRRHFAHRLAVVVDDRRGLVVALGAWLSGQPQTGVDVGEASGAGLDGLAAPAIADPQRRTDLQGLGRHFTAGGRLDAGALFPTPRRRVPLPTYPFAGRRFWVTASAPDQGDLAPSVPVGLGAGEPHGTGSEQESAAPAKRAGPIVRLAETGAIALARTPSVARAANVTLSPLVLSSQPGAIGVVERTGDDAGVRVLTLSGVWGRPMAEQLSAELVAAGSDAAVRAVVLGGDMDWRDRSGSAWDPEAIVTCAVPVVVAVRGTAAGQAAHLALLADFLVLGEDARLVDVPLPGSALTERLSARRLGTADPRAGNDLDAAALARANPGIAVVATEDVAATALSVARQMAEAPRLPLVLLKRHMRRDLLPVAEGLVLGLSEAAADTGLVPALIPSRRVPLASAVVELTLFDDGVVLLRMTERAGRNMFTPALMDGLEKAFATIPRLPEAKMVVLTGHETYFACGGTAEGLRDLQSGDSHFTDRQIYALPLACDLPVIGAMQGHGIGAGWALGMYCDTAFLATEAIYHSNYLWYGFTPGAGVTLVLPHRLGDDLGREVLFTAREYRGREIGARTRGVAVLPASEVLTAALDRAHAWARLPRDELLAKKARAARPLRAALGRALEQELAMHAETFIGNESVRARIAEKFGDAAEEAASCAPTASTSTSGTDLAGAVVASLAEALMIDKTDIAPGDSFVDLGLDSILAVTWIRQLNGRFGITLPATAVYAHPTVAALAAHVAGLVGDRPCEGAGADLPTPVAQTPPAAILPPQPGRSGRRAILRAGIVASLADDLMIDAAEIEDRAAFLELGLDSILAVTWIRGLNRRYGIDFPATVVYAHPSVGALVDHVMALLPQQETSDAVTAAPDAPAPAADRPVAGPAAAAESRPAPDDRLGSPAGADAIAIIGAAGKFPRAADLAAFWANLANGRDCIGEVPASRWEIDRFYDPDPQAPGKTYCKWMGALDGEAAFDARFFAITPLEAELMDPQQRLFLETAWHAIEDAAIDPLRLAGSRCGIYVSSGPSGYEDLIEERNTYSLLGSSGSVLAARIAYLLDLRGPCLSIDTACSSSLVALAQACVSLASGVCDMAIAGGACVLVGPNMFIDTAKVGMLSPQGRCFSFDGRADGFVPGEGVGAVLLKRLDDAMRDGDPIHAVIRGWGVNQDGRTNGITAPNPKAQTALLREVYDRFGIDPATIGLIECHGTGTRLGDPIEIEGLAGAFEGVPAGDRCAIGSVKSNVGHLLASAGIAGVLKAMLALENRQIPPSINWETLNDHIELANTPFTVGRDLTAWAAPAGSPRRAGVSAFGFSGTNAHVVLEESPRGATVGQKGPWIFVLSARERDRLVDYASTIERFVAARTDLDLGNLALTLQRGRTEYPERLAFVCSERATLLRALASVVAGEPVAEVHLSGPDRQAASIIGTDEESAALVSAWLRSGDREKLSKVARLWVAGLDVAWPPIAGASRIHVPGYPFARTEFWVESAQGPAAERPTAVPPASLLGGHPATGEIGRQVIRIEGDEAFLTTHTGGERRHMLGLFLPELARTALERFGGSPVHRLEQLVWGMPATINGRPRDLTVVVNADAEGLLYRVEADGSGLCHLGAAAPLAAAMPDRATLPLDETDWGGDAREDFARFSRLCAAASGPPTPEMAAVTVLRREGDTLTARLQWPRGVTPQGHLFDPFCLDAVWRLLTFRADRWSGSAPGAAQLAFPLRIAAMTGFAPLPDGAIVRICGEAGSSQGEASRVAVFNPQGRECLRLEGVRTLPLEACRDIPLDEEEPEWAT